MRPGVVGQKCPEPMNWHALFTPDTRRLIDRPDNEGMDDPICGCNDYSTIKVTSLQITPAPDHRMLATVHFVNYNPQVARLLMERGSAGWKVYDILQFAGGKSLRTNLQGRAAGHN